MANYNDQEFQEHVAECGLSEEDLRYIRRTLGRKLFFWWILTFIPVLSFYILPVFVQVWAEYKIWKQRTFEPRKGLFFSLYSLAMVICFIFIVPIIIWAIAKRRSVVNGLLKKGLVGDGSLCVPRREAWKKIRVTTRCICTIIVTAITASLYVLVLLFGELKSSEIVDFTLGYAFVYAVFLLIGLAICVAVESARYKKYLMRSES